MVELSQETQEIVAKLFPPESRIEATKVLENDCGSNLPFCEDYDKFGLERIRFAALKLSEGRIEKLKESVQLAKIDWRDLLVMAGFAEDIHAHKKWRDWRRNFLRLEGMKGVRDRGSWIFRI